MTTIVYNDVILRDCETQAFDQEVKLDDSGTDVLFSRFTLRVASNIVATRYPETNGFGITPPIGSTVIERMADVHKRLSEVRKDFWMLIDDAVAHETAATTPQDQVMLMATGTADAGGTGGALILVHPLSGDLTTVARSTVLDCDNGPRVKSVSVRQIVGGRGMRVEVEFEVCRKICVPGFDSYALPAGIAGGVVRSSQNVLSNRWSIQESKDDNWATTRVIEGTLRVAHSSAWPHAMRLLCVPSLLRGYQRVRQSFADDPTNLVLKYRIEDRQAHAAPPPPAVSWSGHHAETASGANGSLLGGEFSIRLTGPPGVDKLQLIGAAGKVAVYRLRGLVPEYDQSGNRLDYKTTLRNASIVDVIDQPTIEMRVQVTYVDKDQHRALAMRILEMGKSMAGLVGDPAVNPYAIAGYHPKVWPVPLPYDSPTPAGIFNCYLQHPCSIWHDVPNGVTPVNYNSTYEIPEPERKDVVESGNSEAEYFPEQEFIPADTTKLAQTDELYDFPYSFIELRNRYETHTGWTQLPLADTDPAATQTAALVRLHGTIARRILTLTATREGKIPLIPTMDDELTDPNGIREVCQTRSIEAKAPDLTPDGQGRRFSLQCQYVYLLERAPTAAEKLRVGATPLDSLGPSENWIDLNTATDETGLLQYVPSSP